MNERTGGSYVVQPDGSMVRQDGTQPHQDGDAPRTADGQVVRDGALPPSAQVDGPAKTLVKPARKGA